ncbi:MAG: TolC family protein [Terriglobales bacterium]
MKRQLKYSVVFLLSLILPLFSFAQVSINVDTARDIPPAPMPQNGPAQSSAYPQATAPSPAPSTNAGAPLSLTLKQAEALAIKNNPQISVARLIALASQQVTREVRSNLWPTATGNLTGVDAESGKRITAGALNNPIIYERAAAGVVVTQLITDFGRTTNLISSANYAAKAENQNAMATRQQVLLAVDKAYYNALQAHAVLTVAQQTVKERETVANQAGALFKSKLKSELDFSFANVNLAQARLLLLDAQNNDAAALATLSMVLGFSSLQNLQLTEEASLPMPPPDNVDDLISKAFSTRPEILSLQFQYQSARKFQTAERDLLFPSISALGAVGDTPIGNAAVAPNPGGLSNTYGAVGANVEIPLFNGFLYTAKAREANLRAQAVDERLRDIRNLISRDVRTSWLSANTAYQRLAVTQQLLQQANLALRLAQSRYNLGLGSIVELSQAQLQQTQAGISYAEAGYDYRLSLAVLTYETTGI